MAKESRKKIWLTRLVIFIALLIVAEIGLRIIGYKPKVLINWAYMPNKIVNDSMLYADEFGITHYVKGKHYKPDTKINDQGFIGNFNYDSSTVNTIRLNENKKVVMAIGDSFLDGCCSDSTANSYAGYLSNKNEYVFLNYGVAGTDPLQYKLIVEHFAPEIKPDIIMLNVYLGNDIMPYDRTPKPFMPACYIPKGSAWLNSEPPTRLAPPNTVLKDFNSAIEFYQSWYTLKGKNRNPILKFLGNSILFSKAYLGIEHNIRLFRHRKDVYYTPKNPPYTYNNLKWIAEYAKANKIKLLVVAIPTPADVRKKVNLKEKYGYCFNEIPWTYNELMTKNDYDGKKVGNHFNNKGHKKMATYLHDLILDAVK